MQDGAIDVQEAAATVGVEAARLERLVRDLLDLARMNRTDFSIHPSEIDLAEVADDAVRRYQQQAEAFGVALRAVSDGSAPAIADADRVLQIVSNLVENALRLTPAGGEVRVVSLPGELRVEDTGPGLEDDDRDARVRALLSPRALRPRAPGRHRPRPRDREGADGGHGRHRLRRERPRGADDVHRAARRSRRA